MMVFSQPTLAGGKRIKGKQNLFSNSIPPIIPTQIYRVQLSTLYFLPQKMLTALPCREESNSAWHSGPFLAPGSLADFSLQSFLLSHLPHILKRSSRLRIQSWPLLMLSLEHLSHSHSLSTGLTLSHSSELIQGDPPEKPFRLKRSAVFPSTLGS